MDEQSDPKAREKEGFASLVATDLMLAEHFASHRFGEALGAKMNGKNVPKLTMYIASH